MPRGSRIIIIIIIINQCFNVENARAVRIKLPFMPQRWPIRRWIQKPPKRGIRPRDAQNARIRAVLLRLPPVRHYITFAHRNRDSIRDFLPPVADRAQGQSTFPPHRSPPLARGRRNIGYVASGIRFNPSCHTVFLALEEPRKRGIRLPLSLSLFRDSSKSIAWYIGRSRSARVYSECRACIASPGPLCQIFRWIGICLCRGRARIKDRTSHREFIERYVERGVSSALREAPRQPRVAAGYNETKPSGIQMLIRNSFRMGVRLNRHELWGRFSQIQSQSSLREWTEQLESVSRCFRV